MLNGGSANARSTHPAGSLDRDLTQSPGTIVLRIFGSIPFCMIDLDLCDPHKMIPNQFR